MTRWIWSAALLLALAALAGCDDGESPAATPDQGGMMTADGGTACRGDDECPADQRCREGLCADCTGSLGCACDAEGACATGECVGDTCTDCQRGALGCACTQMGGCDLGGTCDEATNTCVECPAGQDGCACGFNDFCEIGLLCQAGVCAAPPCPAGTEGCPCADGACHAGLACNDDRLCYACANDMAGCPCVDGACEAGLICDADACREPTTCAEAACGEFRQCQEPAAEGERPTCLEACDEPYVWDPAQGACVQVLGATCAEGPLNSIAARCAGQHRACDEPAPDAAVCGACLPGFRAGEGDACVPLATCAALNCEGQNRACTAEDVAGGADAACAACLAGFIEVGGACLPVTCERLNCAAQSRVCDESGAAPACGGCAEGFADEGGVCVPFVPATCEADAPGSILAACQAQQRACVAGDVEAACGECLQGFASRDGAQVCEPAVLCAALGCGDLGRVCEGEPFAACGACEPGAVEENPGAPGGRCVRRLACEDIACLEGQFCIEGDVNTDAVCSDRPCPEGQALRAQGVGGVCVDCAIQCGETGETGETYPYTRQDSDECICETRTGFYADVAGAVRALPCDEDGDGWVRLSARSALESEDPTIQANARCPLREIDRFELRNQHGQTREILSCVEGLQPAEAGPCQQLSPVGLYESVRNDSPIELARANVADVPPVVSAGGAGRALRAEELNSLVRYCVSANADYNDNLTSDLNEHHGQQPAAELDAALAPFVAMSYFGELATGAWQAPAEGQPFGRYVIAERSRCGDEFALGYAPGEGENWRGCTLNRDAAFDAGLSQVGFDFARFGCDAATGTCPLAPPVTSPRPAPGVIQPHGLCEVALPPADGIWRGMNLHSQFKCVAVVAPEALPQDRRDAPQLVTVDELYDGQVARRKLQLNRCAVACPAGDAGCALDCEGERCATSSREGGVLANPAEPVLTCTPSTGADAPLAVGDVGFAAVRYDNVDGAYRRGCINEWDPSAVPAEGTAWRALCPGYDAAPDRVVGQANTGNFGTIMCGCGLSYGGAGCRLGCPEALADLDGDGSLESDVGGLHYGGPAANQGADCANGYCPVQGRRGYWVCGGFNATTLEADDGSPDVGVLEGGDYLLLGGVTAQPAEGDTLCEHDDCAQGYRLRAVDFTDRLP